MANLGDFAAAAREADREQSPAVDPDDFTFCGEQFFVHGRIPTMLMLQLGASATGKIDENEGLAAMWEALRVSLRLPEATPEGQSRDAQFDRLYRLAVDNDVDLPALMKLTFALFGAQAGRPTKQAPASSAGAPGTSPSSKSSSSHPALAHLRPVSEVLAG